MTGNTSRLPGFLALAVAAALSLAALSACSTVNRMTGKDGAATESEVRDMASNDPLARPTQVAWTSARASFCGFVFNPAKLRADYMASEIQAGATPGQMEKIEHAYDYTRQSVLDGIKEDLSYCTKERNAVIRRDLNRYLAGDYSPNARMAR
jgi:aerobic-type carbon monoxide dehydrogenase small subunit (CoxS/CutS family)